MYQTDKEGLVATPTRVQAETPITIQRFQCSTTSCRRASVFMVHLCVAGLSQTSLLDYLTAPMPFLVGVHDTLMSRVNALPTEDE